MNLFRQAVGHLLACRDVTRLLSQLQERKGTCWELWRVQAHLAVCEYCSRFDRQMAFLRETMRRYRS